MGITLGVPRSQFVYISHIAQPTLTNILEKEWLPVSKSQLKKIEKAIFEANKKLQL